MTFRKALAVFTLTALPMLAGPATYTATSGNLAASVLFTASGNSLVVTLTNTSTADVLVPTDVLTAVFFDLAGATLSPVSALLAPGSSVWFGPDGGGNVGGEWAYAAGLSAPHGATRGISSAGYGLFGGANFNGDNLQGPAGVDGGQYGITSAGDDPATGNTPVTGGEALIHNSVVFTLSGLPAGFDPEVSISNVSFQYGTALTDPNLVPEPGFYGMLALGLGALLLSRSRRTA